MPPLAAGWGMGDGECVGEVTRASLGALRDGVWGWTGTLEAIAGEPDGPLMEPKLMLGLVDCWVAGAPLGIWPEVPEALIMTEGFLPWSPFCMVGCGVLFFAPFTGDTFPCCALS